MVSKEWSREEIQFLRDSFGKMTQNEIAVRLGRTIDSVKRKMERLRIIREKPNYQVGQKFGRLTLVETFFEFKYTQRVMMGKFICDCNPDEVVTKIMTQVANGIIVSCGCYHSEMASKACKKRMKETGHGLSGTRLHRIWQGMKNRCLNNKVFGFHRYGGRGIKICEEWKNDFVSFYNWAINNGYDDKLSIDRIDNDGNYEPSNCRWSTMKAQAFNTSRNRKVTSFGETKTLQEWFEDKRCTVLRSTLESRLNRGWQPEFAITHQSRKRKNDV